MSEKSQKNAPPRRKQCVVVGVGASAGGLEAYKALLKSLPAESGLAFVLVQHLDPTHESLMTELLGKHSSMPVIQAENAMPVVANHVYMIPPKHFLSIRKGMLFLEAPVTRRGVRLPIDHFFQSLAHDQKERSVCIVLTGTGSDGASGLREVKGEGGMTIVQQPEDAEYDGMPRAAIATGVVDFVVPIAEIADLLLPYATHPYVQARPKSLADTSPAHYQSILSLLRAHTDHDFNAYKPGTLTRRIERRMGIRHVQSPSEYLALLRAEQAEVMALFQDLLIGVTRFFRDEPVWESVRQATADLIAKQANDEPLRVWVPGCSTGEEAYTLAIMLSTEQTRLSKRFDVQIFATDIDTVAVEVARAGVYANGIAKDLPEDVIDEFFIREGDTLRVKKRLRERCVFAVQNLLTDPPFSGLDMVACRNLLIYLEPGVQRPIFEMFHFALKPQGLLLLGTSESPTKHKHLFEPVSQQHRLYRKKVREKTSGAKFPVTRAAATSPGRKSTLHQRDVGAVGMAEASKKALLDEFAPASVVVDGRAMIQFIHGPIRKYADFPRGEPDLELGSMAMEGLKAKTRSVLHRLISGEEQVADLAPRVQRDGDAVAVGVRGRRLPRTGASEPLYLISFIDEPLRKEAQGTPEDGERGHDTGAERSDAENQLALELQATREDLQSTIEELESANEELKASNEEVMSMNEELQSTNEELETSREELQSLNEELSTVNNQLHDKVGELEATNDDLSNLLSSTDLATLFLDQELRIRRFTPTTARLMNLIDSDIGRPISDLANRFNDTALVDDALRVLADLAPVAAEVQNGGGHWYMRRITPFRTSEDRIAGVVVTLTDVTSLKTASRTLELRERQQASIAQLGRAALEGEALPPLFERACATVATTLGWEYTKILRALPEGDFFLESGVGWRDGVVGNTKVPGGLDSQAGFTLRRGGPVVVEDLRTEKRFSGPRLLRDHDVIGGLSVVIGPDDAPWGVLGAHCRRGVDISVDDTNFVLAVANILWQAIRRDAVEAELRSAEERTAAFLNNSAVIAWMKDGDGRHVYLSDTYLRRFNVRSSNWLGKTDFELWPEDVANLFRENDQKVLETGAPMETIEHTVAPDGTEEHWLVSKFFFCDASGSGHVGGLGVDISERVRSERALKVNEERLRTLIDSATVGIALENPEGRVWHVNDALLDAFQVSREQFDANGFDWSGGSGLPQDQEFGAAVRALSTDENAPPVELYRVNAQGDRVCLLTSARIHAERGAVGHGRVVFVVDLTQQKQAEEALGESEERMQAAARMAGLGSYHGDLRTGEIRWSPELRRLFGISDEQAEPKDLEGALGAVIEADRARMHDKLAASLDAEGDGVLQDEYRIRRPDGVVRWMRIQGKTVFSGRGSGPRALRVAGVVLDITDRHDFEDKLDEARRLAEAANDAKSDFLARMSHELRTPVSAILGFAEVLEARLDDAEARACASTIRNSGIYLCELLDDILDLEKIEAGKLTVHSEPVQLLKLIAEVRSLMSVPANERDLRLEVRFESELPVTILSDTRALRQILLNLLGNAIKFTPEGEVRVHVRCLAEREQVEIDVVDTGTGIAADDVERLFLPFEQIESSLTRSSSGSGLGLSITRHLVTLLGGELAVESEPGAGSTFTVRLPTGPLDDVAFERSSVDETTPGADSPARVDEPRIRGRILIVDDRADMRFLLNEMIVSAGAQAPTVEGGEQCLAFWRETRDTERAPDAMLVDLQMPGIDGLETTRRLRKSGFEGPILAVTANAVGRDRERCREAGCDDVVLKPVDRRRLISLLASRMKPQRAMPCILVLDDHEDSNAALKTLLEMQGCRVAVASTADEALRAAEARTPDVALIDLNIGEDRGDDVLAQLRERPAAKGCKAVCVSGQALEQQRWEDMGFDAFLRKPVSFNEIAALLEDLGVG